MTHAHHEPSTPGAANLNAAETGVDRRTLDAIFRHPLAHNLSWREVVNLFGAIGGAEEKPNGGYLFRAGTETLAMNRPHGKDLTGSEVIDLRRLLTRTGWSPDAPALSADAFEAPAPRLIVVIDHAGARIHSLRDTADETGAITDLAPRHVPRDPQSKPRDADREEIDPDDERFFEGVAAALSEGGDIVVIGHGKGQSNEADHLTKWLEAHDKPTHDRIVREIVADLPHMTTPELLQLGRHAFG